MRALASDTIARTISRSPRLAGRDRTEERTATDARQRGEMSCWKMTTMTSRTELRKLSSIHERVELERLDDR